MCCLTVRHTNGVIRMGFRYHVGPDSHTVTAWLQVALARSGGRTADAIEALKTYLDNYPNDADAWEEQAELYLEVGRCAYVTSRANILPIKTAMWFLRLQLSSDL